MAHHFSVRLASLTLAGVAALGTSAAAPAFADGHDHGHDHGDHEHRSCQRFDRHNKDEEGQHRRHDCRDHFRHDEEHSDEHAW